MPGSDQLVNKRYILHRKLGEGGMGSVYMAEDRLTRQMVAFKRVIAPDASPDATLFEQTMDMRVALTREFELLASLRHPNVIEVIDYGFDAGRQPYFTMNLLQNSQTLVEAGQNQSLSRHVELLTQLLQALSYLHRRGILHRDLKPANVLVESHTVRVLDFGLAMLRDRDEAETVAGTMAYIAPEVLQGGAVTAAADLYAVGIMAYELFVGRHPYNLANMGALLQGILYESPDLSLLEKTVSLDSFHGDIDETTLPKVQAEMVGGHLVPWLERLLAKDPAERFQSADEAMHALLKTTAQKIEEETEAIREAFLQAAKLTGRDSEMQLLTSALRGAIRGQGGGWLLGGESGVGKSRLVDELRIRAMVEAVLVLRGQAVREGGAPYLLWRSPIRRLVMGSDLTDQEISILKAVVPDIDVLLERDVPAAAELEPQQAQERLIGTIISLFKRQEQPILLLLEDLHWYTDNIEILRRIIDLASELPLMIVGSYRDDERPEMADLLSQMTLIKLGRLGPDDMAALAASMIGEAGTQPEVVSLLQRETEGNAFFLVEVVRALAEQAGMLREIGRMQLPAHVFAGGIQQIVQNRIERVPAAARALLDLAAILGRQLDLKVLRILIRESSEYALDDWLRVCANAAILDIQDEVWRFAHDKIREGLVQAQSPELRKQLHRKAADALETAYTDLSDKAAALAFHWGMAEIAEKELHYARIAGRQASETSNFGEAKRFISRAIELEQDVQSKRLLHYQLGEVLRGLSDYDGAVVHYDQARSETDAASDGLALLGIGRTRLDQGDFAAASESLNRSLDRLRESGDERNECYTLYALSRANQYTGHMSEANEFAEHALNLSRKIDDKRAQSLALFGLGMNHISAGMAAKAREYLDQAHQIDREIGNRRGEGFALMYLGVTYFYEGQSREGISAVQQTLSIARDIGDRRLESLALVNLGGAFAGIGQFDVAIDHGQDTLNIVRAIGDRRTELYTLLNLAESYRMIGQIEDALDYAREARGLAEDLGDQYNLAWALGEVGISLQHVSKYEQSAGTLSQALKIAAEVGAPDLLCRLYTFVARVHLLAGQPGEADQACRLALEQSNPDIQPRAGVLHAIALLALGQRDAAVDAVAQALKQLEALGEQPQPHYTRGLAMLVQKLLELEPGVAAQMDQITAMYQSAMDICAAQGIVAEAQQELELLGTRDDHGLLDSVRKLLESALY